MKNLKSFLPLPLVLASCMALAADTPFQVGKYYGTGGSYAYMVFKVDDIKGSWVLVSDLPSSPVEICGTSKTVKGCWINTNVLPYVQEIKGQ